VSRVAVDRTAHAYILYANEEVAKTAYETAKSAPPQLDDRQLIVMRYSHWPKHLVQGSSLFSFFDIDCYVFK